MKNSKDWIYHTNVYEVNVRQYTPEGTFKAFEKHLPRLKEMGVQTLWFMPVTPISQKNKKGSLGSYYACSDYCSINPEFGTMNDFKSLVAEAQKIGFKIIIDWVANHTGWDHIWTIEHPEWYEKDESTGDFKRASGMDDIIELDFNNKEMRNAMIDAMKFWIIECNIDGFRCDLAFWVELDFWLEAIPQINKLKPLFWLAESDPIEFPGYMEVFDSAYSWSWMHKTEEFCKKDFSFRELISLLDRYLSTPGIKAWFTSNHDENSWNGTEYEKYDGIAKLLAVFSCTWKGMPLIYSGQELPNLKRLEFFEKDVIKWTKDPELHNFYKKLLKLNAENPALRSDSTVEFLKINSNGNVICYKREKNKNIVLVFLNFSNLDVEVQLHDNSLKKYNELFSGKIVDLSNTQNLKLKAFEYIVLI